MTSSVVAMAKPLGEMIFFCWQPAASRALGSGRSLLLGPHTRNHSPKKAYHFSAKGIIRAKLPQDPQTTSSPAPSVPTPMEVPTKEISPSEGTSHERSLGADIVTTLIWIASAGVAAGLIANTKGAESSLQFVTAYIVEYSLSVDNLFVFLLIFNYFQVPSNAQSRVLTFGIIGAIVFRGIMIVAGEALTSRFKVVTLAFAAILLYSAAKILFSGDEDDEDVSKSPIVKFASRLLPFSDHYDGENFFTNIKGTSVATPLMLVLLSVELSDVVFALDSVPAVLGISKDPLIIYLSNIFAIAGLRSLFFVLADSIGDLRFLPQALAIVLAFVGSKMIAGVAGYEVSIVQSLSVVVGTLALGIGGSLLFPEEE